MFLGNQTAARSRLAAAFLVHLQRLAAWFESQRAYQFIASSLFLAYDDVAAFVDPSCLSPQHLRVHLIDFARCRFSAEDGALPKDVNFLYGLRHLIQFFHQAASTPTVELVASKIPSSSNIIGPTNSCLPGSITDKFRPPSTESVSI